MFGFIDNFLNKITMYRLVLYYVVGLLVVALLGSLFGLVPFSALSLVYSTILITSVCWVVNEASAWFFKIPTNLESIFITAIILVLVITPITVPDIHYFGFIVWAAVLSQVTKYVLAAYRKHLFNPVAIAIALTSITLNQSASWWVGTAFMLPFVLFGGFLVVRKIRRFDLIASFFGIVIIASTIIALVSGLDMVSTLEKILVGSPLFFFAFVMLTEPLTTPPTAGLQIMYGSIVGLLFIPQAHIGSLYFTPELALIAGNIFSYIVSPKKKLLLTLKEKVLVGTNIYDFIFTPDAPMKFRPGQYLEWTIGHDLPDNRGNRRYFTIASSPTEQEIIMGVKFYEPASSVKQSLLQMQPGETILAGQLAGDFTLPKNSSEKSVFIAGGIGVTPFRSMIKYLIDSSETRDIVLFYSNKNVDEIAYRKIFDSAQSIGVKTVYTLSDMAAIPKDWSGEVGSITADMIRTHVPDFADRTYYISGPRGMVVAFEKVLREMGVRRQKIKTDFFPGFV